MSNLPDDIDNFNNSPMSPLYNVVESECYNCGSGMTVSLFDKDKLECDNEDCDTILDLSDSGLNDW